MSGYDGFRREGLSLNLLEYAPWLQPSTIFHKRYGNVVVIVESDWLAKTLFDKIAKELGTPEIDAELRDQAHFEEFVNIFLSRIISDAEPWKVLCKWLEMLIKNTSGNRSASLKTIMGVVALVEYFRRFPDQQSPRIVSGISPHT